MSYFKQLAAVLSSKGLNEFGIAAVLSRSDWMIAHYNVDGRIELLTSRGTYDHNDSSDQTMPTQPELLELLDSDSEWVALDAGD
jgi:hypothetical protein